MRGKLALPYVLVVLLLLSSHLLSSVSSQPDMRNYDVLWTVPSQLETESMPLGNGDVTLSVWVEAATGDLMYYAQQSGSYDENGQLLKLIRGRLHLDLSNSSHSAASSVLQLDHFYHRLALTQATQFISYTAAGVRVNIELWVDRFSPIAHFIVQTSSAVTVTNSIEQWRTQPTAIEGNWQGGYYCTPQYVWPDVLYSGKDWGSNAGQLLWYHRNDHDLDNPYYNIALARQNLTNVGLEPYNPLTNRTFGGFISHGRTAANWSTAVVTKTSYGISATLTSIAPQQYVAFDLFAFTTVSESVDDYITRFESFVQSLPSPATSRSAHNQWWYDFWHRSYTVVHVPSSPALSHNLTQRVILQRALDAMDGLNDYPIHFNGQGWNIGSYSEGAQGPDLRQWGSAFWWQNVREMYYPAVQNGDWDILQSMFGFYQRILPVQQLRTMAYYNHTGAYYDETIMMYGLVSDAGFGYTCDGTPHIHNNRWIRYHWDGALELCVLMVDFYRYTQNDAFVHDTLLPVCTPILEFYRLHFPDRDTHNHTIFYPSQSLETWQCPDLDNSSQCETNSIIYIGGLQFVLSEMLQLPSTVVGSELRSVWSDQLTALPPLPQGECPQNSTLTCLLPADVWVHANQNSENVELYMVWPYKLYGLGLSSDITIAINNYNERPFPCNNGWCQDVVDAALLGLTDEAAKQILDRAAYAPADGWKFPVFVGPLQDSTPASDHYSVLRTAVNAVMIQEVPHQQFDIDALRRQRGEQWAFMDEAGFRARQQQAAAGTTALLLFPTLPVGWDAEFKLVASFNTTVWATCRNNTLQQLVVTPSERKSDVVLLGCLGKNVTSSKESGVEVGTRTADE